MRSDPIQLELLRNRFQAVVEEMAENTIRTSFSVFVKQTADFGTCLVTPEGEVFAAPVAVSSNLMIGIPAKAAIDALAPYRPGDVGISNDPDGTKGLVTHLPDLWMWQPMYIDGEIVAFAFSFVHSSDIGGAVPGSISRNNRDMYQEGLRIPPSRLYREGELNPELHNVILANSRIPGQLWGDLKAQLAAFNAADARIAEIANRYGGEAFRHALLDLLDQAEDRAGDIIESLPDGCYRFTDYLEGAGDGLPPTRISMAMTITGRMIALDFAGTSPQVDQAINLPTWGQAGHYMIVLALVNYFYSVDHSIPYNSGLVRPIALELPPGSVVNPRAGAACGVRAAVFFRIMDCVLGCLAQAIPGLVPAASSGAVAIVLVSSADPMTGEQRVSVAQPLTGGSGGRPALDGIDGTSYTGGWLRNVPSEVLEHESPLLVERYGYRPGSGGAGQFRGGAGIQLTLRALEDDLVFAVRGMERLFFEPWGLDGGGTGKTARSILNPGTPGERQLGRIDVVRLAKGDVLHVETAGGGGLGNPCDRAPDAVREDVRAGVMDAAAAVLQYGVVLVDGEVDELATAQARQRLIAPSGLGEARRKFEAIWPQEIQKHLVEVCLALPVGQQTRVYQDAYRQLEAQGGGITVADIDRVCAELSYGGTRAKEKETR